MRCLKSRIVYNDKDKTVDKKLNNEWIRQIVSFDGLIDYIIKEFENHFNQMDYVEQYKYKSKNEHSYFCISDDLKKELIEDINQLNLK